KLDTCAEQKDKGKFSFKVSNLLTIASTFTTKFYSHEELQQHSNPSKHSGLQEDKCEEQDIAERTIFYSVMFHLLCVCCGVVPHSEAEAAYDVTEDSQQRITQL
ncbi:MAG: hypothetical protein MJE68_15735, partial [Proteobacteria bacterium]|nr:hypothetical protein [Pseudomonadota bacterium]